MEQNTPEVTPNNSNEFISNNNQQEHCFLRRFGTKTLVYGGATALVGLYGVPAVFGWIGFSSIGVTAGSWAAWWQSTHVIPGIFAFMQSTTATGGARLLITKFGLGASMMKAFADARKNPNEEKNRSNQQSLQSKL